jgi:predicted O-methyltransferase YrrM
MESPTVEDLASQLRAKREVFDMMDSLEGWCTKLKAATLMDIVFAIRPQLVVEVGVFGGKSLVPMAHALRVLGQGQIVGVDPWLATESAAGMTAANYSYWSTVDHDKILAGLVAKLDEFGLTDHVRLVRSSSLEAPELEDVDVVHIDGNHSEAAALVDVLRWVPALRRNGVIIFDDSDWVTTAPAVEWLDARCERITEIHDTNSWGVWITR